MIHNNPIRVVIAEDDPQNALIQQAYLERLDGFELVGIARSIEDAQELVTILTPDLLLLDVYFPSGNGMQLLPKKLRCLNQHYTVVYSTTF